MRLGESTGIGVVRKRRTRGLVRKEKGCKKADVLIEGGKPGAKQRAGLRGLCPAILSNGYLVFQTP